MLDDYLPLVERAIRRDLLAPEGLNPPHLPIRFEDPRSIETLFGDGIKPGELGRTAFLQHGRGAEPRPQHIAISAWIADNRLRTAATLAHELIHASLCYACAGEDGHGPAFERHARAIGLLGDAHATFPGPRFRDWYARVVEPTLPPVNRWDLPDVPAGFREFARKVDEDNAKEERENEHA